jgi:biotin transporter BioY
MHSTLAFELWPNTQDSLIAKTLLAGSVLLAISANVVGGAKALTLGLKPFIAAEIFKIILAVITLPLVWRLIRRRIDPLLNFSIKENT